MNSDTLLPADAIPTAPPPAHRCSSCGRPLTDPTSRARQVGPDCWAKDHPDAQPGPVRSTAGVGDRDLLDELENGMATESEPDVRERTEWGVRCDASGPLLDPCVVGMVDAVHCPGAPDAALKHIARVRAAEFSAHPGLAATVVSRRVRVTTERGEWEEQ